MITLYKQDGETVYGVKEFLLDTPQDLQSLPNADIRPGSSALIISTGALYMFNGDKQWVPLGGDASSDSPNVTDCSCEELLSKIDSNKNGAVDTVELTSF
jgi:hypothetical protein